MGTARGNPCDPASGNKFEPETDYRAALNAAFGFDRTYHSLNRMSGAMRKGLTGNKWVSTYDRRINLLSGNTIATAVLERPDGRALYYTSINGVWTPDADINEKLVQTAGGWLYTARDGTAETYDSAGRLLSITPASGVATTLTWSANQITRVSDAFGHALVFAYDPSTGFLASLTDPAGHTIRYSYDSSGNLVRVDYPDGNARIYLFENASLPNHLTGISLVNAAGTATRYSTFSYDTSGKAVSTEHAAGVGKFTFSYPYYTQTVVTDAAGTKETMNFSVNLGVKNLTLLWNQGDGQSLYQSFDSNNNLTCRRDETGRATTWTYNASNQKLSETTGRSGSCPNATSSSTSRTTTYQYLSPDIDLPTLIEAPSVATGQTKRTTITYSGKLPAVITQSGFTPAGAAVSRTVTLGYNANGQVTSIDGPRTDVADVTTLAYYNCTTGGGCGQLQRVTNALGHVTTYDSYDAAGRLSQMTDPNGLVTTYQYDPRGRVRFITQGGRVTEYRYDAAGNVTYVALPDGRTLTYTYDAALLLRRVTDNAGNYIDYGYDLKGNRTGENTFDASGTLVRALDTAFDVRNRVSQINAGGSVTKQVMDAIGNLTRVTDPNTVAANGTAATTHQYDELNRLTSTIDKIAGNTSYGYDINDRVKSVKAPNYATTTYVYDDLGNLLSETSPDRGLTSYTYNAAGNVTGMTDARGIAVSYTYDALNRLTRVDYPGTSEDVTHSYDSGTGCSFGIGRLCSTVDESGSTAYAYDAFGNVLTHTHTELGVAYTTRYTYDTGNRVLSITYPGNRVVSTPRDALGRIASVSTTVNGAAVTIAGGRSYRPDGLLLSQNFGNGLNEIRQYDTRGRLTYQSLGTADTRLYAYDHNGNLTGLQSLPLVGSYNYDALDRLSLDQRTTTATTSSTFTYDANGNRKTENTGSYAYLANSNRLQSAPGSTITLDAAGNTTGDGTRSYTYNAAGHLSSVTGLAGYSYNAQRLRSRKIAGSVGTVYHYDSGGNLLAETDTAGALRRTYLWADGQPLAQIETVTAPTPDIIVDNPQAVFTGSWPTATGIAGYYGANYRTNAKGTGKDKAVWTVNVTTTGSYQVYARWVAASSHASNAPFTIKHGSGSQTVAANQRVSGGQWVLLGTYPFNPGTPGTVTLTDNANGTVIADAVKLVATGGGSTQDAVRYLHTDHLNTPRLATDTTQQVVWRWEGTAFGATAPTGSVTVNLRFPGQYYDGETGLHYNWNRYYDPRVGRYISSDPIGLAGGLNTYAYVRNNPLRWTDPRGLDITGDWESVGGIGGDPINWGWRYNNWYGNWCGPGGVGRTISGVDCACRRHDKCYEDCGLDAKTRWLTGSGLGSGCALKCDVELASNPSRNDCNQCSKQ